MSDNLKHTGKDDKDLKEYYAYDEKKDYAFQDPLSEEDLQRRKLSNDRKKQLEDFKRDKDFYYKKDRKKTEEEMVQKDATRDFEHDKRLRKTSVEIVKETQK